MCSFLFCFVSFCFFCFVLFRWFWFVDVALFCFFCVVPFLLFLLSCFFCLVSVVFIRLCCFFFVFLFFSCHFLSLSSKINKGDMRNPCFFGGEDEKRKKKVPCFSFLSLSLRKRECGIKGLFVFHSSVLLIE